MAKYKFGELVPDKAKGSRGKESEQKVKEFLDVDSGRMVEFYYHRYVDSRAAGRVIKKAIADFEVQVRGINIKLDVKETEVSGWTLAVSQIPQMATLRRHDLAGGVGLILVYFKKQKIWKAKRTVQMEKITRGSWNFEDVPGFKTAREAFVDAVGEYYDPNR